MESKEFESTLDRLSQFLTYFESGNLKNLDNVHLNKILVAFETEVATNLHFRQNVVTKIYPTVIKLITDNWPQMLLSYPDNAVFCLDFFRVISNMEEFRSKIIGEGYHRWLFENQMTLLQHSMSQIRCSYISALSKYVDVIMDNMNFSFKSTLIHILLNDPSIYVQRSVKTFLKEFLREHKSNLPLNLSFLNELLAPIINHPIQSANVDDDMINRLTLLTNFISDCAEDADFNAVPKLLCEQFKFKQLLKESIERVTDDGNNNDRNTLLLECLVTCYFSLIMVTIPCQTAPTGQYVYIPEIFELHRYLLERKRIDVMYLSCRGCNLLWPKIARRFLDDATKMEMHLFFVEMFPICQRYRFQYESEFIDKLSNKVLEMIFEETYRMYYAMRDCYLDNTPENDFKISENSLNYVAQHFYNSNDRKRVLMFQSCVWMLKLYLPLTCDEMGDDENRRVSNAEINAIKEMWDGGKDFLFAIIHASCILIEQFNVQWDEAVEGIYLVKICAYLLVHPDLTPKLTIGLLRLAKLTINQFFPPQLMLLYDQSLDTPMDILGPSLVRHLHSAAWEVRDSTLEVISAITQLAHTKYPILQEFLLRNKLPSLAVSMMLGDREPYVQATATQVVSGLVRMSRIWDEESTLRGVCSYALNSLKRNAEAIVRRQTALLVAHLFSAQRINSENLKSVAECMVLVTIDDLDWEVKVNSLVFWDEMIAYLLQEQGVIDGAFPDVTFSKEKRKIVQLSSEEIKLRLAQFMDQLSATGCLNALWAGLNDDSDLAVVKKSSEVTDRLLQFLKNYQMLPRENTKRKEQPARKRKCEELPNYRKLVKETVHDGNNSPVSVSVSASSSAEDIIDSIVKEFDINLLVDVVMDEEKTTATCEQHGKKFEYLTADEFLHEVQHLDLSNFVDEKYRWLAPCSDDLNSLLNNVNFAQIMVGSPINYDNNQPDCY